MENLDLLEAEILVKMQSEEVDGNSADSDVAGKWA